MTTIEATRRQITEFGRMLFDRQLTDAAGGNISVRVDEMVCITPRYSGQQRQWRLSPNEVLVVDLNGNKLEGDGDLSRESQVHLKLHNTFREAGTTVVHAHARNMLVFAALNQPMPPVLEANLKFGVTPVVDYAPAHSADLAEHVAGAMQGQEARIKNHAAGVIAPWHGLFIMAKNLPAAFDAVERFDTNAYCILMAHQMGLSDHLTAQSEALQAAAQAYNKQLPT
jgi:L-fuculose-phosphate aldolase